MRRGALAALLPLLAGACQVLFPLDAYESGSTVASSSTSANNGGASSSSSSSVMNTSVSTASSGCTDSQKLCDNSCVERDDPKYGCDPAKCDPCDPDGTATMSCAGGGCHVDSCNAMRDDCDGDPNNGCEIDLSSDPGSCGGCGVFCCSRICLGGACDEVAPFMIAKNIDHPSWIAVDGDAVYYDYYNAGAPRLMRFDLRTAALTELAAGTFMSPSGIKLDDKDLYVADDALGTIFRVDKPSGVAQPFVEGQQQVEAITFLGSTVYWATRGSFGGNGDGAVRSLDKANALGTPVELIGGQPDGTDLDTDGTNLVIGENTVDSTTGQVVVIDPAGVVQDTFPNQQRPTSPIYAGGAIYWGETPAHLVDKAVGATEAAFATGTSFTLGGLASDGVSLYFSAGTDGSGGYGVFKSSLTDGSSAAPIVAGLKGATTRLAVDDQCVYGLIVGTDYYLPATGTGAVFSVKK